MNVIKDLNFHTKSVVMRTYFTWRDWSSLREEVGTDVNRFPPKLIRVKFPPIPSKARGSMRFILFPNNESRRSDINPVNALAGSSSNALYPIFNDINDVSVCRELVGTLDRSKLHRIVNEMNWSDERCDQEGRKERRKRLITCHSSSTKGKSLQVNSLVRRHLKAKSCSGPTPFLFSHHIMSSVLHFLSLPLSSEIRMQMQLFKIHREMNLRSIVSFTW